jgi:hypothetical protein
MHRYLVRLFGLLAVLSLSLGYATFDRVAVTRFEPTKGENDQRRQADVPVPPSWSPAFLERRK